MADPPRRQEKVSVLRQLSDRHQGTEPSPTAPERRQKELLDLLRGERDLLVLLLESSKLWQQAILENDTKQLVALNEHEDELLAQLAHLDRLIVSALEDQGRGADWAGNPKAARLQEEIGQLAADLRGLRQRNEMLLRHSLAVTNYMLSVLTDSFRAATYAKPGRTARQAQGGPSLINHRA